MRRGLGGLSGCALIFAAASGCGGVSDERKLSDSVDAVQAVCQGAESPLEDGWGHDLIVVEDARGLMVISVGQSGSLDRPLEQYRDQSVCGATSSPDADIVCINGTLLQWPELPEADRSKLLPQPCDAPPRGQVLSRHFAAGSQDKMTP